VTQKAPEKEKTFEEGLSELEATVEEMESGELPLDKLVSRYEKGAKLLTFCEKKLKEAEMKIEILRRKQDGSADSQPVELSEDSDEAHGT